jgi:small subunit ribosomal protein S9
MPVKKKVKTKETVKVEKAPLVKEKYFYAVGRRKASNAQVKLYPSEKAGENDLIVNKKKLREYFPSTTVQNIFLAPLKATATTNKFKINVSVRGGGFKGQAEAIRLAISRSLVKFNEEYKKSLRDLGYLTRDSRVVERKKPGLKKARRAPQWAKR